MPNQYDYDENEDEATRASRVAHLMSVHSGVQYEKGPTHHNAALQHALAGDHKKALVHHRFASAKHKEMAKEFRDDPESGIEGMAPYHSHMAAHHAHRSAMIEHL